MKKFICIIIVLALISGFMALLINAYKPTMNMEEYKKIKISVKSGDTLDGYYYKYADTRDDMVEYREAVKELNNMRNSMIYANTYIYVYKYIGK